MAIAAKSRAAGAAVSVCSVQSVPSQSQVSAKRLPPDAVAPPKSITRPFASVAMLWPLRAGGAFAGARSVQTVPSQTHVSARTAPS